MDSWHHAAREVIPVLSSDAILCVSCIWCCMEQPVAMDVLSNGPMTGMAGFQVAALLKFVHCFHSLTLVIGFPKFVVCRLEVFANLVKAHKIHAG